MSSKRAMRQAQKQAYAKHRSNITNNRFELKKEFLNIMSSKKAMKQAQKQAYAKHRSNITNSRFDVKKKKLS